MNRLVLALMGSLLCAGPALAQAADHSMHDMSSMPGMAMPAPAEAPPAPAADPHAGHDMSSMPGMAMPEAPAAGPVIPHAAAPAAPRDHLADRYYDPAAMAAARRQLAVEHGGAVYSMMMANLLEYQSGGYRWDAMASFGGDIDRFVAKTEGEGGGRGGLETGEVQALYSRAVGPYFDLQAGLRQDVAPAGRTYLTLGTEGLAPYWFDVEGAVFLSTKGEVLARLEATYDLRLTQRLLLQPRMELNLAAQDTRATRTGAGLSTGELGLRLRYEIIRQFAPYVGVSFERKFGATADFARAYGREVSDTRFVAGIRTWF